MTAALKESHTGVGEVEEAPTLSPYLVQVLDEVERASAPLQEPRIRPTPAAVRTPRPFAYD